MEEKNVNEGRKPEKVNIPNPLYPTESDKPRIVAVSADGLQTAYTSEGIVVQLTTDDGSLHPDVITFDKPQ